jgi:hypothetical protein
MLDGERKEPCVWGSEVDTAYAFCTNLGIVHSRPHVKQANTSNTKYGVSLCVFTNMPHNMSAHTPRIGREIRFLIALHLSVPGSLLQAPLVLVCASTGVNQFL